MVASVGSVLLAVVFSIVGILFLIGKVADDRQKAARRVQTDKQIKCPHCGAPGRVSTREGKQKQGISGGKATAGILTGGLSLLFVGLSQKASVVKATCTNCGMSWTIPSWRK